MSDDVEALAEIFKEHRVEQLGFPGAVKCHACDDWTEGTIHQHHAELAKAFFAAEVREALAPVWALAAMCPLDPAVQHQCCTLIAAHDLAAALPDDQRKPGEAFCSDCPDHEGCSQGVPCGVAKRAAR